MRIISILNFKGGVGKTSLAINLGYKLALEGKNVLIIDCDLQANATTFLKDPHKPTLLDVLRETTKAVDAIQNARPNVDLLPSDGNLDKAAPYIISCGNEGFYILKNQITEIAELEAYDFIFFDHSPSYSAITESVLLASQEMIIPCELGTFSIEGLLQMIDKLQSTLSKRNHTLDLAGVVPFKYNASIRMHETYLRDLQETFNDQLLPTVRQDAAVGKSQHFHQSVFEYDPTSKAAHDFTQIASLLIGKEVTV